ncbi:MAG: 4Fe-4S binding protein [Desulfarculaceae bacterium]|nr:4Fe-4S binding protein [Desulfarculaceae bacterium]MCF8070895.1 4Fe-4S binding protein [Desulfarculaceae bacterium]MCF8100483.1 4Fe-4S binding protein [Desulfarculaceae bacterium]MCF8118090.1 4Fe-4S binding protein [Desulfarculaceae bacterium]
MSRDQALRKQLQAILEQGGAALWGVAGLNGLVPAELGPHDRALSFALAMDPAIMASIAQGPNQPYCDLYDQVNQRINALSGELAEAIASAGHQARAVPASIRSDPVNIRGDFPHKTAATRAGLGWIGKHCQLVTRELGPWLRLGTVLTDAPLTPDAPLEKSFCGKCMACVEACPAGALRGAQWTPGLAREDILAPAVCDAYKKEHFMAFHQGHNCGICTSACPWGHKLLRRASA